MMSGLFISNIGLGFIFMTKNGKNFNHFSIIIFLHFMKYQLVGFGIIIKGDI